MSEKRFESFYGYAVDDKATGKRYSDCNTEELVDLLNSLSEENEQLKDNNEQLFKAAAEMHTRLHYWQQLYADLYDKIQQKIPPKVREVWLE